MMIKKKHRVLFVSSEAVPFAKVGGLADVVSSLSKTLAKTFEVIVIIPKYRCVSDYIQKENLIPDKICSSSLDIDNHSYSFQVDKIQHKENTFFFMDIPELFDRPSVYIDVNTGTDYRDNIIRYSVFSRAVLETFHLLKWIPDIVHCHDWHTALIPLYLKFLNNYKYIFSKTKSVFTIHNLAYQGIFSVNDYPKLGLDWKYFHIKGLEYYRNINFMKAGIVFADAVNTVSPTYAQEIKEEGAGLEGVIREKEEKSIFCGIMNGVDYSEWDPKTDTFLEKKYQIQYDVNSLENKEKIRIQFAKEQGLKLDKDTPLIGMISRLYDQKGIDIFLESIEQLLKHSIAFTILGNGKKEYEKILLSLMKKYPQSLNVNIEFNIELSHYIEAASDMFLMPSQFEPSGLNQLYSLRYGSVPIVRKTGGLSDSVFHLKTGFVFNDYTADALSQAVLSACDIWRNKQNLWYNILEQGMKEDWSWTKSSQGYIKLYNQILSN